MFPRWAALRGSTSLTPRRRHADATLPCVKGWDADPSTNKNSPPPLGHDKVSQAKAPDSCSAPRRSPPPTEVLSRVSRPGRCPVNSGPAQSGGKRLTGRESGERPVGSPLRSPNPTVPGRNSQATAFPLLEGAVMTHTNLQERLSRASVCCTAECGLPSELLGVRCLARPSLRRRPCIAHRALQRRGAHISAVD